jgi:hypothetical protein
MVVEKAVVDKVAAVVVVLHKVAVVVVVLHKVGHSHTTPAGVIDDGFH